MPQDLIPAEAVIQLNAPVLIFTLCVAVLTSLMFGLAPAIQSSRRDLNDSLRDSGKGLAKRLPGQMAPRRSSRRRSRLVLDLADQRWIAHAELRRPAPDKSRIAGRPRLPDDAGPACGPLQDHRAGSAIFPAASVAGKSIARSGRGSGVKPASAVWGSPEQDRHRRKDAPGRLADLVSVRQRGIFPHVAN